MTHLTRPTFVLRCVAALLPLLPYWPAYAQTIPRSVEADTLNKEAQPVPQPTLPPMIESAPTMAVQAPKGAEKSISCSRRSWLTAARSTRRANWLSIPRRSWVKWLRSLTCTQWVTFSSGLFFDLGSGQLRGAQLQ